MTAEEIHAARVKHCEEEMRYWTRQVCDTSDAGARACLDLAKRMHREVLDAEGSLRLRVHDIERLRQADAKPVAPVRRDPKSDEPLWRA